MPDYDAMYKMLFNAMTEAISILQDAQKTTEEMYISSKPPDIKVINTKFARNSDVTENAGD